MIAMIALRSATAADVDTVLEFWRSAAEDAHRPADSSAALHRLLVRDPEALILALDGEQLVGSIIAGWDGWRCHLYRLAVAPDRRRSGLGRALVEAAERRFAGFGATRVDAMVLDQNLVAHGAWSALGYQPQGEWSRWVRPLLE
jgi:ribosomal protein S18 acetylase RimI-like enzyme